MKKLGKAVICILFAALAIFGLVAKYQTHGIYLFKPVTTRLLEDTTSANETKLYNATPLYLYKNDFGKVVIAQAARSDLDICLYHSHDNISGAECSICYPPPNRIQYIQSVTCGFFTTHFDFLSLYGCPKPLAEIIRKAGLPTDLDNHRYFIYQTIDGYQYKLMVGDNCLVGLSGIQTPDNRQLSLAQINDLIMQIRIVYAGAAVMLSLILFLLLKHFGYQQSANQAARRPSPKVVAIAICCLILIGSGIKTAGNFDYYGLISSFQFHYHIPYIWNAPEEYSFVMRNGAITNHFGKTAVFTYVLADDKEMCIPLGTYSPSPLRHMSLLSFQSGMTVTRVLGTLGIPDECKGSAGNKQLSYELPFGYTCLIQTTRKDGASCDTVKSWTITAPDGTELNTAAYQWQVRLTYLGIAAGLSAIAAALTVPGKNRRKKAGSPR